MGLVLLITDDHGYGADLRIAAAVISVARRPQRNGADFASAVQRTIVCYCGVNWVLQTCPELVDTSTLTGEPGTDRLIGKVMTAVPALSATRVNGRVAVG